jgi:hypothetical protein
MMKEQEEFSRIYRELKAFFVNSGDLASAILPFVAHTNDFQLAVAMLHSQIETFHDLRV